MLFELVTTTIYCVKYAPQLPAAADVTDSVDEPNERTDIDQDT